MSTVPVAFVNQLTTGRNAKMNCVPACLASGAAGLSVDVQTAALLDAEYGTTYTGPTAPWRYADDARDTLRSRGLVLETVTTGDEAELVARGHDALAAGDPVLYAIPSEWGNFDIPVSVRRVQKWPDGSWLPTHFVCIYQDGANWQDGMNPWGGFKHTNDDAHWARLLVLGRIWILRREAGPIMWKPDSGDSQQPSMVDAHGTRLHHGMAAYVKAKPTTANAVEGIPAQWYTWDAGSAYTVLEDSSVLQYQRSTNDTVQIGGRAGAALSGALRALAADRKPSDAPPADPRLVECASLVKALAALAPSLP